MMDLRLYTKSGDECPDLIHSHTYFAQSLLGQDLLCSRIEDILLRKCLVGIKLGRRRCRHSQGGEDHNDACGTTVGLVLLSNEMNTKRPIGLQRLAVLQKGSAFAAVEIDEIVRQRQGL